MDEYDNAHEFLKDVVSKFKSLDKSIESTNSKNVNTIKSELLELPHWFFSIKNPAQTIFNIDTYKTIPWWMIGEILSEFLNLNPPIMSKYRPDLIEDSYKLTRQGTAEYMYGSRWSEHNQIENVRQKLAKNPTTKRALIQTWMPYDTNLDREDVPCNINYMFLGRDNKLDMTATIRSNDLLRGAKYDYYLAAFMQQSMASWCGLEVGQLYFLINSLHVYKKDFSKLEKLTEEVNASTTIVDLKLDKNLNVEQYWKDLRHIKKCEDASYAGGFEYYEKNVNDISYSLFRDFARIFGIRNAKFRKEEKKQQQYIKELENDEVKKWLGVL
ncbi:MAG TPA: thymidylate synthase [Patescibacteria group bacterium]|nr:thymidylate synthase [Patescibacteria group bacterium]